MPKIVVTGGTGMLGNYVCNFLARRELDFSVLSRPDFDLDDFEAIADHLASVRPDVILHLAAETNVDLCERDPARAGIRNHLATGAIARGAAACGAWLLYISTSNVFGSGGKIVYNELDTPDPVNFYGRSKLAGENDIRYICPNRHFIVRSGWMIGGGEGRDHKFVGKTLKMIKDGSPTLSAVNDKFGAITYAKNLAEFIEWAIERQPLGTVHFSSVGTVSRFDIAQEIGNLLGYAGQIAPVASAQFPLPAPRPLSEGMESLYLPRFHDAPQPSSWRADLKRYLEEFEL